MRVDKIKSSFYFACVFLSALILLEFDILAVNSSSYVYMIDGHGIHRRNIAEFSSKLIYNTSEMYMVSFSTSLTSNRIAVLISKRGTVLPGEHDYSILPRNYLSFIDADGNVLTRLDEDVRKFSWSPDGEKIAYITGTYYEGGVGFKVTGVGIFDFNSKSKSLITKDFSHDTINGYIGGGYEINWAKHDSNIYIRDFDYVGGIYKYDTKSGKSEKVEYYGIDFSPDGKYYVNESRLYLTSTNVDITDQLIGRFGPEWPSHRVGLYWVFDNGSCLRVLRQATEPVRVRDNYWENPPVHHVLYDVEEDEILRPITLEISRWTGGPSKLVFDKDQEIVAITYEEVYKR